jgi:guanylate kinase
MENFQDKIDFNILRPEPLLLVISGPSGVGKDAVLKCMQKRSLPFHFVVTATSRPPREGEVDGVDYFFVTKEKFEDMIARNELIEHAWVYEQYKGIPKEQVRQALASGKDVVMRLDVQGAAKVRALSPQAVLIFLAPSDNEVWYNRLKNRKSETPENFRLRLESAKRELLFLPMFDYIVVNEENQLEKAVDDIMDIINTEHHRQTHRKITL